MIPKTFHLVWGGDKPLPDYAAKHIAQLKELYPGWSVNVWDEFPHDRVTGDAMDIVPNHGARSDIMRLEILYKFGGVYLDVDVEPLQRFPWFDVFSNISCKQSAGVGNYLMAANPGSRSMRSALNVINKKVAILPTLTQYQTFVHTGPDMCGTVFMSCGDMTIIEKDVIRKYFKHHKAGSWLKNKIPPKDIKLVGESNLVGWKESQERLKQSGCCDPVV